VAVTAAPAADPVIHLRWDNGGAQQPVEGTNYIIDTTETGTPQFPDVKLITGRLDWRIWSTDSDNNEDFDRGDIGVISCPNANNFAVTIEDPFDIDGCGARNVEGIHLVPTSSSNHSSISYAKVCGDLTDELIVQAASGNGGDVFLIMNGVIAGEMSIPKLNYLEGWVALTSNVRSVTMTRCATALEQWLSPTPVIDRP